MGRNKTLKQKQKARFVVINKQTKKCGKININGGGILWDSNREKIVNHLVKSKAINKSQKQAILNASSSGNKTEKIQKFVDEAVTVLIQNIIESWQKLPSESKNNTSFASINKFLNIAASPNSKESRYDLAHNLYKIYTNLDTSARTKLIDDGLAKVNLSDGRNGGMAFELLYKLYKNWIDAKVLNSLPSPKFADLYSNWFGKEIKSFFQKYWWVFI